MIAEPECRKRGCRHFGGVEQPDGTESSEVVVCPAYPDGIPRRITLDGELHLTAQKDQVGSIVFEETTLDDRPEEDEG